MIWKPLRYIYFDLDASDVRGTEQPKVQDIVNFMKANPGVMIALNGHTDQRGTGAHNQGLSDRRVKAVRDALKAAGIAEDRVQVAAFGESKPTCVAQSEECFQQNRRVEVLIRGVK